MNWPVCILQGMKDGISLPEWDPDLPDIVRPVLIGQSTGFVGGIVTKSGIVL